VRTVSSLISLVVGPQHPALHEPERFIFKIEGETVVDVEPRLGYVHRGIEKLMETKEHTEALYLAERVCGICNVAHTLSYAEAVEEAAGIEAPPRAKYLRVIAHELNRIHSHLLLLGVAAELMGFETLFMLIWRDREVIMKLTEDLTGNRVISAFVLVGGVSRDISPELIYKMKKHLPKLYGRVKQYRKMMEEDPTFTARTVNIGYLSKSRMLELGGVGPTARGSSVKMDIRSFDPYETYDEIPFNVIVYDEGDSWARFMVRVDEVLEAINIILYALDHLPQGPIRVRPPRALEGEGFGRVEAPRGEVFHHTIWRGKSKPWRHRIRTPTYANIPAVCEMFKGYHLADAPVILGSIDPCFACTDRLYVVDVKTGEEKVIPYWYIRKKYWKR